MFEGSERDSREGDEPTGGSTPDAGQPAAGGKPDDESPGGSLGSEGEERPGKAKEDATEDIGVQERRGETGHEAPEDDAGT